MTETPRGGATASSERARQRNRLRVSVVLIVLGWTYAYNVLVKEQSLVHGFFQILDTISDDFVLGSGYALLVGLLVIVVFSATKLYTQIISNVHSFRIIEDLVFTDLRNGQIRAFWSKIIRLEEQPLPDTVVPRRLGFLLISFGFLYVVSWVYVLLFSEALYFVCWSAGVKLPLRDPQSLLLLPMLGMAIPFSARGMAYLRYPYTQDYADFMPGALFVLLVVAAMGWLYGSKDHEFFLVQVFENQEYFRSFVRNGAFLAFIPLFFEAGFWLYDLRRCELAEEQQAGGLRTDGPTADVPTIDEE